MWAAFRDRLRTASRPGRARIQYRGKTYMTRRGMAGARWGMRLAGIAAAGAALAGCSMGSMFGSRQDNLQLANANATPAQIAQGQANALPSIATACPPVKIMPGAQALFYYGGGKTSNPDSLHYETSFDQETRNCVVSNGLITVKM